MKNFLYSLCLLTSCSLISTNSLAATLRLAYNNIESYPYLMGKGRTVPARPGLALDVINQAAKQLNIDVKYVRLPGKRVLQYIKDGKVDGGFIFSFNQERANYALYPMKENQLDATKRIVTLGYYFYTLNHTSFAWNGVEVRDSQKQEVGAHLGFSVVKQLKDKVAVQEVRSTEQLFGMLFSKRLDAIAIQDTMADKYLKSHRRRNEVMQIPTAISTKDYYLVFSHQFGQQQPELIEKLWQTIGDIRDDIIEQKKETYLNQ